MRFFLTITLLLSFVSPPLVYAAESYSRRDVLGDLGALGFGAATGLAAAKGFDVLTNVQTEPLGEHQRVSYVATAFEQHLVMIGKITTVKMLRITFGDAKLGNAGATDAKIGQLLENPFQMWKSMAVVAPLAEEAIFRWAPGAIFGHSWLVGTISAAFFAEGHNLGQAERHIPLPQFIGGIWFWYLLKHRGISHAIVAHAVNNNTLAVAAILQSLLEPKAICDLMLQPSPAPHSFVD